jgi:thioredoxin 1
MVLVKLNNDHDDVELFKKIITQNDECPDLIICYFTAKWCGPCKKISPDVTNIGENNEHLRVIKIDVDECEEISSFCQIDCMPTFKFYKNNNLEAIHSFSGADTEELINTIKLLLKTDNEDTQNNNEDNQDDQDQDSHDYKKQYEDLNNEIKDF